MNIILVGESCVGKTEIKNYLCDNFRYKKAIAYTTRTKRENEINGEDYNFITVEEFLDKFFRKDIMCVTSFGGDYYGLPVSCLHEDNLVMVLDVQGTIEYAEESFDNDFIVIHVKADNRVIERRKEKRNYTDTQKSIRKMNDIISLKNICNLTDICGGLFEVENNGTIGDAVYSILEIIAKKGD